MATMRYQTGNRRRENEECLLRQSDFVADSADASLQTRDPAWEANTLPLSYTREIHSYFSPKIDSCKQGASARSRLG